MTDEDLNDEVFAVLAEDPPPPIVAAEVGTVPVAAEPELVEVVAPLEAPPMEDAVLSRDPLKLAGQVRAHARAVADRYLQGRCTLSDADLACVMLTVLYHEGG